MDASATSAGTDFKLNPVYIGRMAPPLERFERREEPEAQGGEFVEAYVAKRTNQVSPKRSLVLDASATYAGANSQLSLLNVLLLEDVGGE